MELKVAAKAFLPIDKTEEELATETEGLKNLFGIEDVNTEVCLTLNLEEFLWAILQKIEPPTTPLKVALHKKVLEEAAVTLSKSQAEPDLLPDLSQDLLDQVRPYLDDDEKFEKMVDAPFMAINQKDPALNRVVPLPARNMMRDLDFVTTIAQLFEKKMI